MSLESSERRKAERQAAIKANREALQRLDAVLDTSDCLFMKWPRCTKCNSLDLKTTRSTSLGGDEVKRHTACNTCGHKFSIYLE